MHVFSSGQPKLVLLSLASDDPLPQKAKREGKGYGDTAIPSQFFTPPVAGISSKVMNIYLCVQL